MSELEEICFRCPGGTVQGSLLCSVRTIDKAEQLAPLMINCRVGNGGDDDGDCGGD